MTTPTTRPRKDVVKRVIDRVISRVKELVGWALKTRPGRTFSRFSDSRGELMAAGLSFSAIFAVFAALYVLFAVTGLFLEAQPALRDSVVSLVSRSVPGLIDTGQGGAVKLETLLETRILGWTGLVAVAALGWTALGWMDTCRTAIRAIFQLPNSSGNFFLVKLKDLGLVVGFGIIVIASAAISVFSTQALQLVFGWLGVPAEQPVLTIAVRTAGLIIALLVDTITLAALFRVLTAVPIPRRSLIGGALVGGIALGILKVLGTTVVGGAGRNPLLAGFVVIIGLMLWLNLICRVILLAASWIAVDPAFPRAPGTNEDPADADSGSATSDSADSGSATTSTTSGTDTARVTAPA